MLNADAAEVGQVDTSQVNITGALDRNEQRHGVSIPGRVRDLVNTQIVNVMSKSLGVLARNEQGLDVVVSLLPRNSEAPPERLTDFGTDTGNQAAVDIRIMAGERDSPDPLDCQEVGVATLRLPMSLPARSPIRVKFAVNEDGRLGVSATDLSGGGSVDVEFQIEAVMNADEVAKRSTALRTLLTVS